MDYTFAEYQREASRTANRKERDTQEKRLANFALGLSGESGEVADEIKKHLYHNKPLDKEKIQKELGDVLWYVATLAHTLDIPLAEVAMGNIEKLKRRYPDGFTTEAANARADEDPVKNTPVYRSRAQPVTP